MKKEPEEPMPRGPTMTAVEVEIRQIRPFPEQPRKNFDYEELSGLMESIKAIGQQQPITIKPIIDGHHAFELIDGERRLKACTAIGQSTIIAFIRQVESEDEQFVQSVAANFCRAPHTPLETANALGRMINYFIEGKGMKKVEAMTSAANICGHSLAWVQQHLGLLKLCPEIQEKISNKELHFQAGLAMVNLESPDQQRLGQKIIDSEMSLKKALDLIRKAQEDNEIVPIKPRRVRPSEDYQRLARAIESFDCDVNYIMDMKQERFDGVFANRSTNELIELYRTASDLMDDLSDLVNALHDLQVARVNGN